MYVSNIACPFSLLHLANLGDSYFLFGLFLYWLNYLMNRFTLASVGKKNPNSTLSNF